MKKITITLLHSMADYLTSEFKGKYFFTLEEIDQTQPEASAKMSRFTLIVPDQNLDKVIDEIQNIPGVVGRFTLIEVTDVNFAISDELEKTMKRQREEPVPEGRITLEQLVESASKHTILGRNKVALAGIAAVVAWIGLFLNDIGIIIGAMLLAPFLGPIYAFAIHTAIGDLRSIGQALQVIWVLVVTTIGLSLIITLGTSLVISLPLTTQITSRLVSNPVFGVMTLFLGLAIIIALSRGIPEGLAGVAVAAALLPPAVVVGIAVVLSPESWVKALVLVLQNVFGLMTGSIIGVSALAVRPRAPSDMMRSRKTIFRVILIVAVILGLLTLISILV